MNQGMANGKNGKCANLQYDYLSQEILFSHMKIGVIGTGMMGAQLAIRLAKSGHEVIVFNRDRSKAQIVQHSIAENEDQNSKHTSRSRKKF